MFPIAGIQKLSLVDYPGHLCAIVFTQGCNMHCPYCHNVSLVPCEYEGGDAYAQRWEEVFDYLSHRRGFIEGVCITGGEPTLHRELPNFIHELRLLGYKVKLDTNGTNPGMVEVLLRESQIDYVAMDIKTCFDRYNELGITNLEVIENIKKTKDIIINLAPDYEFRTTVVPGIVEEEDIRDIVESIKGARRYVLQAYHSEYVLEPDKSPAAMTPPEKIREYVRIASPLIGEVIVRGYGDSQSFRITCCT